jgi:hypothetical protein
MHAAAPAAPDFPLLLLALRIASHHARSTLSSVSHVQLLRFNTMRGAFGNFSREANYVKFFKRMNQMGAVWCCIDAHPGHIHYDFWWDVPHVDKFGRNWTRWEPQPGP